MSLNATIVGGPRDGKIVPVVGPMMYEPYPAPVRYFTPEEAAQPVISFAVREYTLSRADDGDYRYVCGDGTHAGAR